MAKRVIIVHQHRDAGQTARNWMTAAKIIGALVVFGLLIQYWYVVVALLAIGGVIYWQHEQHERRKVTDAKRMALQANIARLERELGIGVNPTHTTED